jgi:hypothetical protein
MLILPVLLTIGGCAHTQDAGERSSAQAISSLDMPISQPWAITHTTLPDGRVLLAAASHNKNYLEIYELSKDRKLTRLAHEEGTGYHPDGLRWADTDKLYVCGEGTSTIQRWAFDEKGLRKESSQAVSYPPIHLWPSDLDGDGRTDLLVSPYSGNKLTLMWGNGDNKEFTPQEIQAGKTPQYARIVDWNGDGKLDIIWSDYYDGSVQWAKNEGNRKFTVMSSLQPPGKGTPRQVEVGDMDGDGAPDVIMALETGMAARILLNDGKGGVRDRIEIPAPVYGYSGVGYAKIDGEPLLSLSTNGTVYLVKPKDRHNLKSGWEFRSLKAGDIPQDMQFVDLDKDGQLDLMFVNLPDIRAQIYFGPVWEQAEPVK